jgi:hypothetical protein
MPRALSLALWVGPRQRLVDFAVRMAVDDLGDGVGQVAIYNGLLTPNVWTGCVSQEIVRGKRKSLICIRPV